MLFYNLLQARSSVGERFLDTEEVRGSIPLAPTILLLKNPRRFIGKNLHILIAIGIGGFTGGGLIEIKVLGPVGQTVIGWKN